MEKKKKDGKIFTTPNTVTHMLRDVLDYYNCVDLGDGTHVWPNIKKHIIDNSCGDGAFLSKIVELFCSRNGYFYKDAEKNCTIRKEVSKKEIKRCLETYIHGIELDPAEYEKCIKNLDEKAAWYGITGVKWDIQNRDALSCHDYDGKMDYVVANPPYIRVHDLECDLSDYSFADEGMTDIYLAFYELGFRMLNDTGRMCYIAPSSWFVSGAGQKMRDYVLENQCLAKVEDYGHLQLFENATTYVAIELFTKDKNDTVEYWKMGVTPDDGRWYYADAVKTVVKYDDMVIDGKFYFGTKEQLDWMREIIEYGKSLKKEDKAFEVKNGFATLADDIFIGTDFTWLSEDYVISVIKASNKKWTTCIYPYDKEGKLVCEEEFKKKAGLQYIQLSKNRDKLEARSTEEPWYAFGRTQAINDVQKTKWAIKSIVKSEKDLEPELVKPGSGVYGGLYILPKIKECKFVKYYLDITLQSHYFMDYVKMLRKYKSGGYYTFSSKELENYLNWTYKTTKKG